MLIIRERILRIREFLNGIRELQSILGYPWSHINICASDEGENKDLKHGEFSTPRIMDIARCRRSANMLHCRRHSITSSAKARMVWGKVRPIARAALRLTTN